MTDDPAEAAMARIEAALARLEGTVCSGHAPADGDPDAARRHNALRAAVTDAIGQLDSLIAMAGAEK